MILEEFVKARKQLKELDQKCKDLEAMAVQELVDQGRSGKIGVVSGATLTLSMRSKKVDDTEEIHSLLEEIQSIREDLISRNIKEVNEFDLRIETLETALNNARVEREALMHSSEIDRINAEIEQLRNQLTVKVPVLSLSWK